MYSIVRRLGYCSVGRILENKETINGVTDTYDYYYTATGQLETVLKNGVLVEEYHRNHLINGISDTRMDALRGISNETLTYDDEDRILSTNNASYVFDDDGFLTKKYVGVTQTLYNYSSRGELLSVAFPNGAQVEYVHDPLGRRIAKKVNGTVTEKYLWQGLTRLLAVFDGSDNLLMRFQYADGRMPVSMTKNGSTYYLFYDQVGSLKAVADSSGNIVKSVVYDSYGYAISDSNTAFTVPYGFAGGLFDRHTGLVRFGYRDYDPETGRWTAKDPIFFTGGDTDLYGYVLNDPVNRLDPTGLIDSLSARVMVLVASGHIAEAVELAESGGGPIAQRTAQLANAIATTISRYPLSSNQCGRAAKSIYDAFKAFGANPQILRLTSSNAPRIMIGNDYAPAEHEVVKVGEMIYDAFTGAQGMAYNAYMSALNGGLGASSVNIVQK